MFVSDRPHKFHPTPCLWKPPICSLYLWVQFFLSFFFVFLKILYIIEIIWCLSMFDLFHLTWYLQGPSRLSHMAGSPFFFNSWIIFCHMYTTFSLFMPLSMNTSPFLTLLPHPIPYKDLYDYTGFSSVQLLSCVRLFVIPWITARQASLSVTNSQSSPKPMSTESVMPSSHLILCHPLLPPSIFPNESFPMSQLFASGGQSIGVSASTSVLPMNTQDWFPLGWTGWTSLQSKELSRVFSNTTVQKHQFLGAQLYLWSNSHVHTWLRGKPIALTTWTFAGKVMSLFFSMLSRLVMAKQYLWAFFFATLSRWEKLITCCP